MQNPHLGGDFAFGVGYLYNMGHMKDVQQYFSFVKWTPVQITQKAEKSLAEKKKVYAKVAQLPQSKQTFESVILAIEAIETKGNDVFRPLEILKQLSPDKKVRDASKKMIEWSTKKSIQIIYNKKVYLAIKYVYEHVQPVSEADKRLLDLFYSSYKRMGFDLSAKDFKRLKEINSLISKYGSDFSKRLNDWDAHLWMTLSELDGLSQNYIDSLVQKNGKYKVTLQYPDLMPFLSQATNSKKRKELADLASEKGGKENLVLMEKTIALRKEQATLLGYANFTNYTLEKRMAKDLKTVVSFENDLASKLAPLASKEIALITEFKKNYFGNDSPLKYFEVAYLVEEYKKKYFTLDSKEVREYFEMNHVVKTLMMIVKKVFGVSLSVVSVPLWHNDVFVCEAKVGQNVIGYIALDLFPRDGKYGHAMVTEIRDGRGKNNERVLPIMVLICNFAKPTKESPSILSHGDVETLFHEFGHALHGISAAQPYSSLGAFQVAYDFVEVPSQFFEQWVWNKDILKILGKHYKTKKPIPDELIHKMLSTKNFMESYYTLGQLVNGMFDIDIHTKKIKSLSGHNAFLRKKYTSITPSKKSLYPASFEHLMFGYESGYYSYLWSLVYAFDMFSEFEKHGVLNGDLGKKVRKLVFEPGALKKEMDLLRDFLGREPSNEAFLKELGI